MRTQCSQTQWFTRGSIVGYSDGVGLRADTFHTDYGDTAWTTTLGKCAFAKDVTVNGTITWEVFGSFVADLTVRGTATAEAPFT